MMWRHVLTHHAHVAATRVPSSVVVGGGGLDMGVVVIGGGFGLQGGVVHVIHGCRKDEIIKLQLP